MSTLHSLKISNPTGDAVLTKVEMDGETQYISQFDIGLRMDSHGKADGIEVRLVYPYCGVEVELDKVAVKRQYSVRLFVAGYEGVTAHGYGETITDALRDMAGRLDAGQ